MLGVVSQADKGLGEHHFRLFVLPEENTAAVGDLGHAPIEDGPIGEGAGLGLEKGFSFGVCRQVSEPKEEVGERFDVVHLAVHGAVLLLAGLADEFFEGVNAECRECLVAGKGDSPGSAGILAGVPHFACARPSSENAGRDAGAPGRGNRLEPGGVWLYSGGVKSGLFARWQANFWAGLAIVLPGVISIAVLLWLFRTFANITDTLLIFLPRNWTHQDQGLGPMYWYCSVAALTLAVFLIGSVGLLARNYFGKKLIEWVDSGLMRVPLLNKIYSATKQVNDAFSSGSKTAFRTVVLVEFPHPGAWCLGFVTSEDHGEVQAKLPEKLVCVFVPATPNPTSGFMLFLPEDKVIKLEMSVADGIKYIISLGSILPRYAPGARSGKVTGLRAEIGEQSGVLLK